MDTPSRKISLSLSDEQLKVLKPVLDHTGKVDIVASIEGNQLKIAMLACQAAFTSDVKLSGK